MEMKYEINDYVESLNSERERLTFSLSDKSKVNAFMKPFVMISSQFKLRRINRIDSQLRDEVSSSLNSDDYRKRVKYFIKFHPISKK